MKSVICSIVVIVSLSAGSSLFAQGRGRGGGVPAGPQTATRPARAPEHSSTSTPKAPKAEPGKQISDHPGLASNVQRLLPAGTDMNAAASGFKNMGQFVAAAHVSHNLNIPFDQLKTKMVTDHMSLGGAVHALKPEMSKDAVETETKKAETEAKKDTSGKS